MVIDEFLEQGKPKHLLLKYVGLPSSSYYYTSTGTKAGKRPANYVYDNEGSSHDLKYVTEKISELLAGEFVDYGYYKTYRYLNDELGLNIGSYRTYNLMKENGLLKFQRDKKKRSNRNWVKELVPNVASEFSFLEFDIKYVYIQGTRTNTQVLTVIDVYSRWVLGQYIANSIKSEDVIKLFEELFKNYPLPEQFIVRNDNGSQFEALIVQDFLKNKGVIQEFTKPATPEQNAHIESYHSIMESAVCQRFEFQNLQDFQETMVRWKKFYNFERIHGGLKYKSPKKFLESIGVSIDPKWNN
ncbi:MAG: DDE domain-containing protein [Flavobacteriales bacterium]|nr:DDE domain-containing protein [Crocinitomicaceae bacterium]NBX80908.1 DDE domain-containing protein [Flavobacteriales bacterium]NCA19823.1 DDE domain-containing protein [Crocinitomicaceae bacterium]